MRRARLSHHRSVFEPQNMVRELRRFLPLAVGGAGTTCVAPSFAPFFALGLASEEGAVAAAGAAAATWFCAGGAAGAEEGVMTRRGS